MRLEGRVAIVTGGARGIGRATCLALAGEGASLIVLDYGGGVDGTGSGHGPADEVVDAIAAKGGKAIPHYGDVRNMETGTDAVQKALNQFGRVDILVNNAGILRDRMLHNMSEEEWDAVLDIHLKGTFVCTRAVAPVYREQRSGVVVNTSSESGLGNMGQANYSAAKEGITGFTRTIARDLGRYGCRANSIRPRAATRMTLSDELREAMERTRKEGMALGDGASGESPIAQIEAWVPEGVAAFTTWLCTDEAANVNGQDFIVSATEVSLMTQPTPERTIFTDDVWTVDELSSRMRSSVTRGLVNRFVPKKG
jgi:NAD(P)-dependent dehydrogenase (short-subunit alcohol dehydrogenase family)